MNLHKSQLKEKLEIGHGTIVGTRSNQEDYSCIDFVSNKNEVYAVLADGMGGHAAGEVASTLAVSVFEKALKRVNNNSISTKLGYSLAEVNSSFQEAIRINKELDGMGSTLIGAVISPYRVRWISVGDSVLYIYSGGHLKRLNADHSMSGLLAESVRQGKISIEEAEAFPGKNALRSAVTGNEIPLIDSSDEDYTLSSGDILLLASDGINSLSEKEIENLLKTNINEKAAIIVDILLNAVEQKKLKNQDNTTIQIVKIFNTHTNKSQTIIRRLAYITSIIAVIFSFSYYAYQSKLPIKIGELNNISSEKVTPTQIPNANIAKKIDDVKNSEKQISSADNNILENNSLEKASEHKKHDKVIQENRKDKVSQESIKDKLAVHSTKFKENNTGDIVPKNIDGNKELVDINDKKIDNSKESTSQLSSGEAQKVEPQPAEIKQPKFKLKVIN